MEVLFLLFVESLLCLVLSSKRCIGDLFSGLLAVQRSVCENLCFSNFFASFNIISKTSS